MKVVLFLINMLLFAAASHAIAATDPSTSPLTLEKVTLQLAWKHQFEFAGFYAAIEQGYFAEQGLEVELREYQEGIDPIDEVLEGRADFGIASDNLLYARLQGQPVVLLANYLKRFPLVILTRPGIDTLADLKGKRLMIADKDRSSLIIRTAFHRAGLVPGKNIELVPHTFNADPFIHGEVDAMTAFYSNEPFYLERRGVPYQVLELTNVLPGMGDANLFTSEQRAKQRAKQTRDFVEATNKGWRYALDHPEAMVDLIISNYSTRKSREALLYEAEKIDELIMPERYPIGMLFEERIRSVAQALLTLGHKDEVNQLQGLLFDIDQQGLLSDQLFWSENRVSLNPEERQWLQDHPSVRYCFNPLWDPYDFRKDGQHQGVFADYLKLIEQRLGITLTPVHASDWRGALELAEQRGCDLISGAVDIKEREDYLAFSTPYFDVTQVLIARSDRPFVANIGVLKDKIIAVQPGSAIEQMLRHDYPEMTIVPIDTKEINSRLDSGEVYAFVLALEHAGRYMKEKRHNFKIIGKLDYPYPISVAVRNDQPILLSIINKALATLRQADHNEISRQWNRYTVQQQVNYSRFWQFLVGAVMLLLAILAWNRILKRTVAERTLQLDQELEKRRRAERELRQHQEQLEVLVEARTVELRILSRAVEQSHSTFVITDLDANIKFVNPAFSYVTGYSQQEAIGQNPRMLQSGQQHPSHFITMWETLKRGDVWRGELHNQRKDGSLYWEFAVISPVKDENGQTTHYVAVKENITARKEAEQKLRESENQKKLILQTVPDLIWLKDVEGNYLACNPMFERFFGAKEAAIIGKNDYDFVGVEQADLFRQHDKIAMDNDQKSTNEEWVTFRDDGHRVLLETTKIPLKANNGTVLGILGIGRDITRQRSAEEQLRLAASVFEHSQQSIIITDAENRIIDANPARLDLSGYSREEMMGENPRLLSSGVHGAEFYAEMWQALKEHGFWEGEIWNRKKSGELFAERVTINTVQNEHGVLQHYVSVSSDITYLKKHENKLKQLAYYDVLTGLPNRRLLIDRMHQALSQAKRRGKQLAACYIDLDDFKPVNDTYGHKAGDQVLIETAERLLQSVREGDTVARLGGDEFVLLILDLDAIDELNQILERVIQMLSDPFPLTEGTVNISASIGIALFPEDSGETETLLRLADQAMYGAKRQGKNQYHFFGPDDALRLNAEQPGG